MKLSEKQRAFMKLLPRLLDKLHEMGFEVTEGDGYRDPRVHGDLGVKQGYGHATSCHKVRLAIDLNLWKDGEYLEGSEAHRELGEWWEKQHELARWGGRFNDGNHYSFAHEFNGKEIK